MINQIKVFIFGKDGAAKDYSRIVNAELGNMLVWRTLEKKYLPSLPHHDWMLTDKDSYISRIDAYGFTKEEYQNNLQDIWMLIFDNRLAVDEKIVLESTFSQVLIKREDFERAADAFDNFKYGGNQGLQANVLREFADDENVVAVGWSNSVNKGWGEKGEAGEAYNLNTGEEHRFIEMGDYDE